MLKYAKYMDFIRGFEAGLGSAAGPKALFGFLVGLNLIGDFLILRATFLTLRT